MTITAAALWPGEPVPRWAWDALPPPERRRIEAELWRAQRRLVGYPDHDGPMVVATEIGAER